MLDLDSSVEFLLFPSPKDKKEVFLKLKLRAGVLEVRLFRAEVSGNEAEAEVEEEFEIIMIFALNL